MICFGQKKSTDEHDSSPNHPTLAYSVLTFRMIGLKWTGILHRTWKLLLFWLPQSTGLENDDDASDPNSVRMEKGDDDAVELLDKDVAGPITDFFQEQEHPADQGGSHELTIPSSPSRQAELSQHISEEGSDHAWDIDGDTSLHNTNCNIDAMDQHGRGALHVALEAAPFDMIEVLLDLGADIRIPDTEDRTPLHLASAMGNEDAIALLLGYGADTSVQDNRSQSALHVAAAKGSAQSVRTLLLGDRTIIQILLLAASWYFGTTLTRENADIGSKARLKRVKATQKKWEVAANHIPALLKLTYYEVVILLDNSWSMQTGQRIDILYNTLARVAEIFTKLTGKGMSLCPLNGKRKWDRLGTGEVANIFKTEIQFEGLTELGTRLRNATVGPILLNREAWPHPMVTLIVTDGASYPEPMDTLQETIRDYKKHPNRESRSFFMFSQVGDDVEATEFLETMGTDIDVTDMISRCPQRLDVLYENSQAACEVNKQYAIYLIGILAAAVEKLV
ncbi:ankyrin repeat-containing domain protein [Aspergillus insuetus]